MTLGGRASLVHTVDALLAAQRSVLLVGPPGMGKSAIIAATRRPADVLVLDPLEHVSSLRAGQLRHALDRGTLCLGATRDLDRARLGRVGRLLWRMTVVRVLPLPRPTIRDLLLESLRAQSVPTARITRAWLHEAIDAVAGRPGFALALTREAAEDWRRSGHLPGARVAFIRALQDRWSAGK